MYLQEVFTPSLGFADRKKGNEIPDHQGPIPPLGRADRMTNSDHDLVVLLRSLCAGAFQTEWGLSPIYLRSLTDGIGWRLGFKSPRP